MFSLRTLYRRSKDIQTYLKRLTTSSSQDVSLSITEDGKRLLVNNSKSYHSKWLRHHCSCDECKASTGQRTIPLNIMSGDILIQDATVKDGSICVDWMNDKDIHSGFINIDWLEENYYTKEVIDKRNTSMEPTSTTSIPFIDYEEVASSDEGLWKWLYYINDKGTCIMNGVPTDEKHTRLIGEKISHIHKTFYGELFDVTAADNPVNLAYTNTELDFHMDLTYYDTRPGLQVLHCYRNDPVIEGGLSTLVDSLAVANEMRETHPKQFDILTKVPVTFDNIHFEREDPVYMSNRSSHIVLDKTGRVVALNWCVSYERPLLTSENELDDYYDAYYTFYKLLESHKLSHQLEPGQVFAFNNLRMLHGRTGVKTNGGQRHLKGFYLNMDEFMSKLNVLSKQLNKKEPIKHPLNGVDYYH